MGMDVFALITDWDAIVKAYREAGGFEFYWDGELDETTAAACHLPVGAYFPHSRWYYDALRSHLPAELRSAADGFLHLLYPSGDTEPHDLAVDAGAAHNSGLPYAMRPATVHTALERDRLVPWRKLNQVADRAEAEIADEIIPDFAFFAAVVDHQRTWLREAAAAGRGIVLVISH